jgi:hypothetical protein
VRLDLQPAPQGDRAVHEFSLRRGSGAEHRAVRADGVAHAGPTGGSGQGHRFDVVHCRPEVQAIQRPDAHPEYVLDGLDGLDREALARAAPAAQQRYWGSVEAWRSLARARLASSLGDHDAALAALHAASTAGLQHAWLHLHDDPDFDVLRGLPAFQQLLATPR